MFGQGVERRMALARILWMLGRTLVEVDVGGVVRGSNAVACTDIWM